MPFEIKKSAIPEGFDFDAAVRAYMQQLVEWTEHDKLVKEGKAQAYPPPVAHHFISSAVCRNADGSFAIDYVITDDGPTAEQILRQKKNELLAAIGRLEQETIALVIPVGKRMLRQINYNDAMNAAQNRSQDAIAALTEDERAEYNPKPIEDFLTEAERKIVDDYRSVDKVVSGIQRASAFLQSEVEDLTVETIDNYNLPASMIAPAT